MDDRGLGPIPHGFPAAPVGIHTLGKQAVEVPQKPRKTTVVVNNDQVIVVAHGARGGDANVVLAGRSGQHVPERLVGPGRGL